MPPPRPPSRIDLITFPVFACSWHGSPSLPPTNAGGCTILAYCGGGGSARTGVGNSIVVTSAVQAEPSGGPQGEGGGGVVRSQVKLDTGDQIGVGCDIYRDPSGGGVAGAKLAAAVGDEVRVYAVPLSGDAATDGGGDDADGGGADGAGQGGSEGLLLGSVTVGEKYGCNAVSWSPAGDAIAVGCENGRVLVYRVADEDDGKVELYLIAESPGHDKAVCSVCFHPRAHPRGGAVLSSGKDGTARLWDVAAGGSELAVMKCSVEDPDPKKRAAAKPKNRRPQQVLVRGCAFGDLEGKVIYTVASGRKGKAYLGKWRVKPPQQRRPPEPTPGKPPLPPPAAPALTVSEELRVECSPVPVSACSISGDASHLALGGVDGTVTYLNLETMKPTKKWVEIHDLPVTCIAARPAPLPLPGDDEEGVAVDVMSASADNRLSKLTLQRRSRNRPAAGGGGGKGGIGSGTPWQLLLIETWMVVVLAFLSWVSWETCRVELSSLDLGGAKECVWHTVLWAPADRPGVAVPPH